MNAPRKQLYKTGMTYYKGKMVSRESLQKEMDTLSKWDRLGIKRQ
jgi:hypothetical protein